MPGTIRPDGLSKQIAMAWMDQTGTVYQRGATGRFDSVVRSNLKCVIRSLKRYPITNFERQERAGRMLLCYDPSYQLPDEGVQVEVNGDRWNPDPATAADAITGGNSVAYRSVTVVEA